MLNKKYTIITILFLTSFALIGQNSVASFTSISIPSKTNNDVTDITLESSVLESFTADVENENVLINWGMNNINDVLGFELYKSVDGSNWELNGFVDGEDTNDYTFSFTVETPNWGINFYRIKTINMDGRYGILRMAKVVFEYTTGADVGNFFPNPTTNGTAYLNIKIPNGGVATIYIHDNMGKLVANFQKTIDSGSDRIAFDLKDLSYGIFYAKVSINKESYVRKIMVRVSN